MATYGPNFGGSLAFSAVGNTSSDWMNLSTSGQDEASILAAINTNDTIRAGCDIDPGIGESSSSTIDLTNFGFSVAGAIAGITVTFDSSLTISTSLTVQLLYNGNVVGSSKVAGGIKSLGTPFSLGNSSDVWGSSLTAAQINSSSFGIRFVVISNSGSSRGANMNYARITIDTSGGGSSVPLASTMLW